MEKLSDAEDASALPAAPHNTVIEAPIAAAKYAEGLRIEAAGDTGARPVRRRSLFLKSESAGRKRLQEIIECWPETKAADEARKLMAK